MTKEEIKSSKIGLRFNEGKLRWSLVDWESVRRLGAGCPLPPTGVFDHMIMLQEAMQSLNNNPESTQFQTEAWTYCLRLQGAGLGTMDYQALEPMVRVLMYGSAKYDDHNWKKGLVLTEVADCAFRHFVAMVTYGENSTDPESHLSHIGHLMCNLMMIAYFTQTEAGKAVVR